MSSKNLSQFLDRLSERERRVVRFGGLAVAAYLVLFGGFVGWRQLEAKRDTYQRLVQQAQRLRLELQPYQNKAALIEKLRRALNLAAPKQGKANVVAEASAAIQRTAMFGGVQVGPIRESAARASARELASMQLEAMGPVPALLAWLHRLGSLGQPLIVESVQITADPMRPGMVKLNLTIVIVDFEAWKTLEARRA